MTFLSSGLCLAAAVGIYCALPQPKKPKGAVRPDLNPSVGATDAIGFAVGIPLFSLALLGAGSRGSPLETLLYLALLLPAGLSVPIFMAAVRHQTSWIRFFGNGFEMTQLGLLIRVRYTDLSAMRVREMRFGRAANWLHSLLTATDRRRVALIGGRSESKTLVFQAKDGSEFLVSSELIPDLQRILIGMDRAGADLPEGISDRERKKIRRVRKRLYKETAEPQSEQVDVAAIAETVRKYRQRQQTI